MGIRCIAHTADDVVVEAFQNLDLKLIGISACGTSFRMKPYVGLLKDEAGVDIHELTFNVVGGAELHSLWVALDAVVTPSQDLLELKRFLHLCVVHGLEVLFA